MSTSPHKPAKELFGVEAPPRNARDRLIQKAIDLGYACGFNAVGLDRIITEAGVTKTTFYKHFESRDDLVLQAIRTRDTWELQAWNRAVEELAGDDPRAKLIAYFRVLDIWFNDPDFGGCLFINAAGEFPNPNDPIHEAAADHKRKCRDEYRRLACAAGCTDPNAFADQYTMLLEGTLVMRQVHGRNDAARIAEQTVRALIDQYVPARKPA